MKSNHIHMKRVVLIFFVGFLTIPFSKAGDLLTFFYEADSFLKKYVENGKVHYGQINQNFKSIEKLYNDIGVINLEDVGADTRKAFYINAYNLVVIYQVAKYYPLKSPLDRSGFFDRVKHTIAGESITLNALEIKKIVFEYKDPRIHFALACAAKSCPPLASFAYTPDQLERQLNERTKLSVNDSAWLKINNASKRVLLSKIFDWYEKDFTMNGENTVMEFINIYRKAPIPANYTIGYYEYDWGLNEG